jgi:hypothetical protein
MEIIMIYKSLFKFLFLLINLNLVFRADDCNCSCGADYDDGNGTKGDDLGNVNQDTVTFFDTILSGDDDD